MEYEIRISGQGYAPDIIDALERLIEDIQVYDDMDKLKLGDIENSVLLTNIKEV